MSHSFTVCDCDTLPTVCEVKVKPMLLLNFVERLQEIAKEKGIDFPDYILKNIVPFKNKFESLNYIRDTDDEFDVYFQVAGFWKKHIAQCACYSSLLPKMERVRENPMILVNTACRLQDIAKKKQGHSFYSDDRLDGLIVSFEKKFKENELQKVDITQFYYCLRKYHSYNIYC